MTIYLAFKEYDKIMSIDIIPASFDDLNLTQQYIIIFLIFCFIYIEGNLIALYYQHAKMLSAAKVWFPFIEYYAFLMHINFIL